MAYITCDDLTIGYDGKAVIEHLKFEVNEGDYLYIVGENGAGKSTLMKTLLNLIDPLDGKVVTGDGLEPFQIGYLPQQTMIQKDFPASVYEIVLSGTLSKCGIRPFYKKEEKKLAEENMKKMSVWDLRKESYCNLSGGQKQRVLLARALCATSRLILLDEPVAGLDPKVTLEFYQLLKSLNEDGITIIMVSHDISAAMTYGSHILHIGKNQLFYGKKEEYKKSEAGRLFSELGGGQSE